MKQGQTKLQSFVEAWAGTIIGYGVAVISNLLVLPRFGYNVNARDSAAIAVVFTLISFVRGYFVRRLFNWWHTRDA